MHGQAKKKTCSQKKILLDADQTDLHFIYVDNFRMLARIRLKSLYPKALGNPRNAFMFSCGKLYGFFNKSMES